MRIWRESQFADVIRTARLRGRAMDEDVPDAGEE
jgi:hypothetical protein